MKLARKWLDALAKRMNKPFLNESVEGRRMIVEMTS